MSSSKTSFPLWVSFKRVWFSKETIKDLEHLLTLKIGNWPIKVAAGIKGGDRNGIVIIKITRVIENKRGIQPKTWVNSFWFHCIACGYSWIKRVIWFMIACLSRSRSFWFTNILRVETKTVTHAETHLRPFLSHSEIWFIITDMVQLNLNSHSKSTFSLISTAGRWKEVDLGRVYWWLGSGSGE